MVPAYQTQQGRRGNCFAACLASIMEMPLKGDLDFACADYPNWLWIKHTAKVLATYNYYFGHIELSITDTMYGRGIDIGAGICIAHGPSGDASRPWRHATVYQHKRLAHDPMPWGTGIKYVSAVSFVDRSADMIVSSLAHITKQCPDPFKIQIWVGSGLVGVWS